MDDFINSVDILGDIALTDSIITKNITEYHDNGVTKVANYAFIACSKLTSVSLPAVINVDNFSFDGCSKLTSVDLPIVESIGNYAFNTCGKLNTVNCPAVTSVGNNAFKSCNSLTKVDLHAVTTIGSNAFNSCTKLSTLIIRNIGNMVPLSTTYTLSQTAIQAGTGYIYVPAALVDSYKAATNWSTFAAQIRAIEDYTVDGTVTGELDPNKI